MSSTTLFFLLLCIPSLTFASDNSRRHPPHPFWRRGDRSVPADGFYDPTANEGSMLTIVPGTFPEGLGEPLNTIVSGSSDDAVLQDQQTNGGLRNYFNSVGFSSECLGQHAGDDQQANLGDGNGAKNETAVIRWDYGDATLGTCKETIQGGNHFRYWVQNGDKANSGAIFMALSYELPIAQQHDIIPNGYNLARDWFIGNATNQVIPTANLTNSSAYTGQTSFGNYTYQTSVKYISNLLQNTSTGINHFQSVGATTNAVDGLVAVLDVSIVTRPQSTSAEWRTIPSRPWHILPLLAILASAHL